MDNWTESERECPQCKESKLEQAEWWDDTPENGGAHIGTKYYCPKCGYYTSE